MNAATAASVTEVPTSPIAGMRPGTSGLRKKVEVWQGVDDSNKHYVENFIQSLVDTAKPPRVASWIRKLSCVEKMHSCGWCDCEPVTCIAFL